MSLAVWMSDWQMQCCGTPFGVGSEVSWSVIEPDDEWLSRVLGQDQAATVTYQEEHHGTGDRTVTGTVRGTVASIRAVHCRLAPSDDQDPRAGGCVSGSARIIDVAHADGWEPAESGLTFQGYLVDVQRAEFQPDTAGGT